MSYENIAKTSKIYHFLAQANLRKNGIPVSHTENKKHFFLQE